MFDVFQAIKDYPYLGAGLLFLLCGLGLPLPEEIVLIFAGYACAPGVLPGPMSLPLMMAWCGGAILLGDLIPYVAGRTFGTRLLRLRWLRLLVTKKRLATFDRWFRRYGDYVIFIARFLPGIRVVAFFTAGTMKTSLNRFLVLDGLGIALGVPLLTWLGYRGAGVIDQVIAEVRQVEQGILWAVVGAIGLLLLWIWIWRWQKRKAQSRTRRETFVEPQRPIAELDQPPSEPPTGEAPPAAPTGSPAAPAPAPPPPPGATPEKPAT